MKLKRFTFIFLFLLVVLCCFGVASAEYSIEIDNMSTDIIKEKVLVETYPECSANPGDTVQISISAEAGYEMDYLEVYQETDNGLLKINTFSSSEGSSFVMPDGNVRVKVLYTALNPQIVATGTYGGDTVWTLDENGTLTVSGTGSVTSCQYGHDVVKVVIQSGITEIGDGAFAEMGISEVEMSDTVTKIGEDAFAHNDYLKRVVLSKGLTNISRRCFAACTKLTDLIIPSGVISIDDFALGTTALATITIPSSVTSISAKAFNYDPNLIYKYNTEFVVEDDNSDYSSQDGVLFNKDKTELVRFPVGRTGEYTIPDTVTTIGANAFSSCGLSILTIPRSVTSIGDSYTFEFSELTDIYYCGTEEAWQAMIPNDLELPETTNLHFAIASGVCGAEGDNLTWTLDDQGTLTISGMGEMNNYDISSAPWSNNWEKIIKIIIDDGVTNIGIDAFSKCSNVTYLFIPGSITSIPDRAFLYCDNLSDVLLSEGIVSIGYNNFFISTGLRSITIPASVTEIHFSLGGSSNLEEIIVNENNSVYSSDHGVLFDKSKTTLIKYPYNRPGELYTVPDSVVSIGYGSFASSRNISSIIIPNSVTTISEQAFEDSSVKHIVIPNSVTTIGDYAFSMSQLTDITLPSNCSNMGHEVFYSCSNLVDVTIPVSLVSIDRYLFNECFQLHRIHYSGTKEQWNVFLENALSDGIGIENVALLIANVYCSDEAIGYCGADFGWIMDDNRFPEITGNIISWRLDNTGVLTIEGEGMIKDYSSETPAPWQQDRASVRQVRISSGITHIGSYAFDHCDYLESVVFDGTVAEWEDIDIGDHNESLMSADKLWIIDKGTCGENLTWMLDDQGTLTIYGDGQMEDYDDPPWQTHREAIRNIALEYGVESIGDYSFRDCKHLTEIAIPESVTRIGNFVFPAQLTSITIPAGVQEIGQFENGSTESCLEEINVAQDNQAYCSVDGVLYNKAMTDLIRYPQKNKSNQTFIIPNTVRTIGPDSCSRTQFTRVVIPDSVTTISDHAFEGCNLTELVIPEGVTYIGDYAFVMSQNLTHVTIPASVTAMGENIFGEGLSKVVFAEGFTHITNGLFECSPNLDIVTIPSSVTTIDDYVFMMDSLAFVLYAGTEDQWNMVSIGKNNAGLDHATIIFNYASELMILANGSCSESVTWTLDNDGMLSLNGIGAMINYDCVDETPWYPYRNAINRIIINNNITSIGNNAFNSLDAQSVSIPESITSIGSMAFYDCSNLRSITIPTGVTYIGSGAFGGKSGIESIIVVEGNETYSSDEYGVLFNQTKTQLICYPCGRTGEYSIPETVIEINPDAFAYSSKLSGITIPEGVTRIEAGTFTTCSRLRNIIIPDSVIWIDQYAFENCYNLMEITFQSVEISWDKKAFSNCWALSNVIVPCSWQGETVLINEELGNIPITERIHKWGEITYHWSEEHATVEAKRVCANDESHIECETVGSTRMMVVAPSDAENGVFDWVSNAFTNDVFTVQHAPGGTIPSLGTLFVLRLPENLTVIEEEAFTGSLCQAVILPDGCTTIGSRAFASCMELLYVFVPESVTSIASDAFDGCDLVVVDRR